MSKSGKLKKQMQNNVQKQKVEVKKKDNSVKIFIILAVVITALVAALLVWDKVHRIQALAVGDEKVYQDEIMYYIYQTEDEKRYIDSLYQQIMGTGYWSSVAGDGQTNADVELEQIKTQAVQDNILAQEAKKAGLSLTEEEKNEAKQDAEAFCSNLKSSFRSEYKIREKNITALCENIKLAQKYKAEMIAKYQISEDEIREGIDYEEYRQYDVKYYSASYQTQDDDGNPVSVDAEELSKRKAVIEKLWERAKNGEDFDTLVSEDDKEDYVYFSGTEPQGVTSLDNSYSEEVSNVIFGMANNEISEVLEDEDARMFYVFKMINNNSDERYEEEVEKKIQSEEDSRFADEYDGLFENYYVTYRQDVWESFNLGRTFTFENEEAEEESEDEDDEDEIEDAEDEAEDEAEEETE